MFKNYEYFTEVSTENIQIEELDGDYRVWENNSIVDEFLTKDEAIELANYLIECSIKEEME